MIDLGAAVMSPSPPQEERAGERRPLSWVLVPVPLRHTSVCATERRPEGLGNHRLLSLSLSSRGGEGVRPYSPGFRRRLSTSVAGPGCRQPQSVKHLWV